MNTDPYAAPAASQIYANENIGQITQEVIEQLTRTKPWVRLMSVLMFLGAGFMLLAAAGMGIAGSIGSLRQSGNTFTSMGFGIGMAVVYVIMAALYIYPALKLWKYAGRIGSLAMTRNVMDLESALNEQRAFWKFVGLMTLIGIALYVVAIFLFVVFGAYSAVNASR